MLMRQFLTGLMVFCVVAGLGARLLAADIGHVEVCHHAAESCCETDHHGTPDEHHHDGDSCPADHHHHFGCCAHALPLTIDTPWICRLGVPGASLLGVRHEGEIAPEGPFLGSEKPPLI